MDWQTEEAIRVIRVDVGQIFQQIYGVNALLQILVWLLFLDIIVGALMLWRVW